MLDSSFLSMLIKVGASCYDFLYQIGYPLFLTFDELDSLAVISYVNPLSGNTMHIVLRWIQQALADLFQAVDLTGSITGDTVFFFGFLIILVQGFFFVLCVGLAKWALGNFLE